MNNIEAILWQIAAKEVLKYLFNFQMVVNNQQWVGHCLYLVLTNISVELFIVNFN